MNFWLQMINQLGSLEEVNQSEDHTQVSREERKTYGYIHVLSRFKQAILLFEWSTALCHDPTATLFNKRRTYRN
jgi:hypothetical protein